MYHTICSIANLNKGQIIVNAELTFTLYFYYQEIKPAGYVNVERISYVLGQLLNYYQEAQQMVSVENSTA